MTLQELDEQRRRRAETAPALQTPPISGVETVNPVAPGTKPKLPQDMVGGGEPASLGLTQPDQSDYTFNQDFFRTYFQRPVSEEEEERRKRGAAAASAIGHLGNVMSAFSNLAFAGEAPSQTLPTVPTPDFLSFSDRLRQQRQQYGSGLLAARARDISEYTNALTAYQREQLARQNAALKRMESERQAARDAAKLALDRDYKQASLGMKAQELAIREANQRSLENYRNQKLAQGSGSGNSKPMTLVGQNGKRFVIPATDKDGVIGYMYRKMLDYVNDHPDENRRIYDISWQFGEGGDQKTKQAAIVASNIQNFPELYDDFDRILSGEQQVSQPSTGVSLGLWGTSSSSNNSRDPKDLTNL